MVQARGRARVIEDDEWLERQIAALTARQEASREAPLGGQRRAARFRRASAQGDRRDRDRDRGHPGQVEDEPEPQRRRSRRRGRGSRGDRRRGRRGDGQAGRGRRLSSAQNRLAPGPPPTILPASREFSCAVVGAPIGSPVISRYCWIHNPPVAGWSGRGTGNLTGPEQGPNRSVSGRNRERTGGRKRARDRARPGCKARPGFSFPAEGISVLGSRRMKGRYAIRAKIILFQRCDCRWRRERRCYAQGQINKRAEPYSRPRAARTSSARRRLRVYGRLRLGTRLDADCQRQAQDLDRAVLLLASL